MDIKVSPANVDRALIIFNTLIKTLEVKKYSVQVKEGATYVITEHRSLSIRLREETVKNQQRASESVISRPTGVLYFALGQYNWYKWEDIAAPLEMQLSKILSMIEAEYSHWAEVHNSMRQ